MKKQFLPILLGSDSNVYSMARSFHEEFGVFSVAVGKRTRNHYDLMESDILLYEGNKEIDKTDVFLKEMLEIYKKYEDKFEKLLLIPCGDMYAKLVIQNKKFLSKYFIISSINEDQRIKLEEKDKFYQTCEKYGLDFPKTIMIDFESRENYIIDFDFPIMLKPADSISYANINFPGKKKAYKLDNEKQLEVAIYEIYSSEYRGELIIQEYIPGDDSLVYVLNTYSNQKGKVKLMALGNVLLQNPFPTEIGNYVAIMSDYNMELYDKMQRFLEDFGYVGYANFDMKYDERDKKFKLFEINVRQGRSSYYVTGAGQNIAKFLIDDVILNVDKPTVYNKEAWLWHSIPKIILMRKINKKLKSRVESLILKMKCGSTIYYKEDMSFSRFKIVMRAKITEYRNFKKYYNS